jgi:cyanophycin synthetase
MDSFVDSRRLTGPNRHFGVPGAVLDAIAPLPLRPETLQRWRELVAERCAALDWPLPLLDVHSGPQGATLAMSAPLDQLFTATEVNEWAWQRAAGCSDEFHAPGHPAPWDAPSAARTLRALATAESNPALMALADAARRHALALYLDDELLSIGDGKSGRSWPRAQLPTPAQVPWPQLANIRKAVVTGSNGKTTCVRLLAAILRAMGLRTGHSCTDGVFVDDVSIVAGDFSGPDGARAVLRDRRVEAAVLETARGGILRRGTALAHADVALVTGISADHFGEYGVHDLDDLARTKLVVAQLIDRDGLLVLNADDATLERHAAGLACPIGWFARDHAHPLLAATRSAGGNTCGVSDGTLLLHFAGVEQSLGAIAAMPLSANGVAGYNIANLAGAALAAAALGAPAARIAGVFARFGAARGDNNGRLMRWRIGGFEALLDYAHNPAGLDGLLTVASHLGARGRLGLLLGQAGNRGDDDIRALAATAARWQPQRVVLKDIEHFLRGRAPGEVPGLLRAALLGSGLAAARIDVELDELAAVRSLLEWAQPGDIVVLPVHATRARNAAVALLDAMESSDWQVGQPLPHA